RRPAGAKGFDAPDIDGAHLERVEAVTELHPLAHPGRGPLQRLARAGDHRHAVDVDLIAPERSTSPNLGIEHRVVAVAPDVVEPHLRGVEFRDPRVVAKSCTLEPLAILQLQVVEELVAPDPEAAQDEIGSVQSSRKLIDAEGLETTDHGDELAAVMRGVEIAIGREHDPVR